MLFSDNKSPEMSACFLVVVYKLKNNNKSNKNGNST